MKYYYCQLINEWEDIMEDRKHNQNNDDHKGQEDRPSMGTPLGHVPINSEVFSESFVGWVKDMLDKDKIPDEEEDKN